jgi:hypothetical protein
MKTIFIVQPEDAYSSIKGTYCFTSREVAQKFLDTNKEMQERAFKNSTNFWPLKDAFNIIEYRVYGPDDDLVEALTSGL